MTWVSKMFSMGIPASKPIGGGRYEYIDILKGFTIIWVLWMHMNLPEVIYPSVQMPIFFFISGTFYHAHKPTLWQQVKSDAYKLLLPSLVFSLFAFGYGCYKGTLDLHGFWHIINQCLSASIVWFLLALFYFRTMAYGCVKSGKAVWLLWVALLIYVPGFYLYAHDYTWIIPFVPFSHMGCFMVWFAIGVLFGQQVLSCISHPRSTTTVCIMLLAVAYVCMVHFVDWEAGFLAYVPWLAYGAPYTLGIILLLLWAAYCMDRISALRPFNRVLTYAGANSIVVYLTHWPLWMYVFKPLDWNVYVSFAVIVLLEFPLIYMFNHYLPWCIGRKYKHR